MGAFMGRGVSEDLRRASLEVLQDHWTLGNGWGPLPVIVFHSGRCARQASIMELLRDEDTRGREDQGTASCHSFQGSISLAMGFVACSIVRVTATISSPRTHSERTMSPSTLGWISSGFVGVWSRCRRG